MSASREDDYWRDDPDALVCWECNDEGSRPRKLQADVVVPRDAPCPAEGFRSPYRTLKKWFAEESVVGNSDPRLTEAVEWAIKPNPDFDRLQQRTKYLTHDDKSFRRSAIVRIAYEATLCGLDEDFDQSRALAYLRDLGVDTNELLPGGDPHVDD